MRHFDLVQRLERLPPPRETTNPVMTAAISASASGMGSVSPREVRVDPIRGAGLGFDYMGSSEFEMGAIPQSARRIIASAAELTVVTSTLVRPTYEEPVHFVCTYDPVETVLPNWHEWSKDPRSRERPHYFRDSDRDNVWSKDRTAAWWALNEDLIWTRERDLAEKIKDGFKQHQQDFQS